ncbi:hypothetical protein ACFL5K_06145, partial [Gemmatimonadota bacterium]
FSVIELVNHIADSLRWIQNLAFSRAFDEDAENRSENLQPALILDEAVAQRSLWRLDIAVGKQDGDRA